MFIGRYEIDGKTHHNIYYKNNNGYKEWYNDTFSPSVENIMVLDLCVRGKTYEEKKDYLEELAIEWNIHFSTCWWSYNELYIIQNWFYENGKRYGLLKEFKENAIC